MSLEDMAALGDLEDVTLGDLDMAALFDSVNGADNTAPNGNHPGSNPLAGSLFAPPGSRQQAQLLAAQQQGVTGLGMGPVSAAASVCVRLCVRVCVRLCVCARSPSARSRPSSWGTISPAPPTSSRPCPLFIPSPHITHS